MTELQALSPMMRRLFDDVDQAVEPQSQAVKAAAAAWQAERSGGGLPRADLVWSKLESEWLAHAFIVAYAPERRTLQLIRAGLGTAPSGTIPEGPPLKELKNRLLTSRLRRVLDLVAARQEPVIVHHRLRLGDGQPAYAELLVAPCTSDEDNQPFFCALALRHLQSGWES
jgi:hypothetical protein